MFNLTTDYTSAPPRSPALDKLMRISRSIERETGLGEIEAFIAARRAYPDLYRDVCREEDAALAATMEGDEDDDLATIRTQLEPRTRSELGADTA